MRHVIQRHKYKLALGLPIALLFVTTLGFITPHGEISFVPGQRFLSVGATSTIEAFVKTNERINVVSGTVLIPAELEVLSIATENSSVDLWTQEPKLQDDVNMIKFTGGMITREGFTGQGSLFTFVVQAIKPGAAELVFEDGKVLAHDGKGTNILDSVHPIKFVVRPHGHPSPDINHDNKVGAVDISILSKVLFGAYDTRYDLNMDGKLTMSDVLLLIKYFGR